MKDRLGESVLLELFDFRILQLETVTAFDWYELDAVPAKMQPSSAIIDNVVCIELFVRMSNEECCATSSLKRLLEFLLCFCEIEIMIKIRRRKVGKCFAVRWMRLQNLLEACDRFVVLLTANQIQVDRQRSLPRGCLHRGSLRRNGGYDEPRRQNSERNRD